MRERSGRAVRAGIRNLLYVRAALEELPGELAGTADRITIVLPWGSLLAAVARPVPSLLAVVRDLGRAGSRVTVVLAIDPERDAAELARLGLRGLEAEIRNGSLAAAYAAVGLAVESIDALTTAGLAAWPTTWARRLAHGRPRTACRIEAEILGAPTSAADAT